MEIIAESEYRFVIPRHGRMRVPGVVFATPGADPGSGRRPRAGAGGQRRGTARHRGGVVCDARCALGVRVPDRRSRRDRRRPRRCGLPGRGRFRHRLRGPAARRRPGPGRTAPGPGPGHGPARRRDPARRRPRRPVGAARPGGAGQAAGRRGRLRGGVRPRRPARPGPVRGSWRRGRRRPGAGQQPGDGPRAAPGRQPGLGEPFPGGPGGASRCTTRRRRRRSGWPRARSAS